jgi:large subunit ribosomal protein L18e
MRKSNTTNQILKQMISELKDSENSSPLSKRIASELERPSNIRREVNLSRLNRYTKEDEFIVVPGKVLGGGELKHKITISALKFSEGALSKIEKSGSRIKPLKELTKDSITGKKIRIIG